MNKKRWLLLIVIIIAAFLRLYHLGALPPGLYPDEAMNGNNALEALSTHSFKVFYPENNGREGLFMDIQALSVAGFGNVPWALRLVSAIFGIFTVLGIYFLGRELYSKRIGLLAAFFLATSFWHINFSRIGFRAIMAPFFLIWGSYLYLRAIRSGRDSSEKHSLYAFFSVLAGIFLGLGFYSYIAYRVAPILFLLLIPFFRKFPNFWRITGIVVATTFIVALPIGLYYLHNPADFMGRTSQVSVFSSATPLRDLGGNIVKTLGMFFVKGDGNWRHNVADRPEIFWPVATLLVIGFGYAASEMRKRSERFPFSFLLLWFILGLLPVVISNEGIPHALRSILLLPPIMIWAAQGAALAYDFLERKINRTYLRIAAVVFLSLLVFEAYSTYFVLWGTNPNVSGAFDQKAVDLGYLIKSLPSSTPKYIVVSAGGVPVRGVPMPTQTTMFITNSFLPEGQNQSNIHYVLPGQEKDIPPGAIVFRIE